VVGKSKGQGVASQLMDLCEKEALDTKCITGALSGISTWIRLPC
jgi:hypothetical protein